MIEVKTNTLFNTAYKLALTSDYGRFRVGAIVARKNKIISLGTNARKSHPLQKQFTHRPHLNSWRHAEVHSLSLARPEDLEGNDIYVCRVLMDGSLGNSKPCPGCMSALKHFNIKHAYFWHNGKFYYDRIHGN
jgi:tRNA(Arg) A34 adenosine deaminase TadA